MNRRILALILLVGGTWQINNAQLVVDGELRTKSMLDHGFMVPAKENENAELTVDQRTRLNLHYQTEKIQYQNCFSGCPYMGWR